MVDPGRLMDDTSRDSWKAVVEELAQCRRNLLQITLTGEASPMTRVLSPQLAFAVGLCLAAGLDSALADDRGPHASQLDVPPPMLLPPVDLPTIAPRPAFPDRADRTDDPFLPPSVDAAPNEAGDTDEEDDGPARRRLLDRLPRPKWSLKLPSLPFRPREPKTDQGSIESPAPVVILPQTPLEPTDGIFRTLRPNRPAEVDRREPLPPTPSEVPRLSIRPPVYGEF